MKIERFFSAVILLACATLSSLTAQNSQKVLFIGNSYVYTNDLPTTLQTLAAGCGDTLSCAQSTPGGCTFQTHTTLASTQQLIADSGWDHVVLQEQSQLPAFPIEQVETECFPYAATLCQQVRTATPDANIIFFMTWGRKNGDASNCESHPPLCTYEGMDSLLDLRYRMMAESNNSAVAPVARVWHALRDSHPEIELYATDGSHPSAAGTYAAAVTFYVLICQRNPTCIQNDLTLPAADAQAIRETAERIVFDSLALWIAPEQGDAVAEKGNRNFMVYPNPCSDFCTISMPCAVGTVEICDALGNVLQIVDFTDSVTRLDLRNYPPALYFAKVKKNGRQEGVVKILRK